MGGNGGTLVTLADERRSQPQQIADLRAQLLELQGRHSTLVQQAALDSQALHKQLLEHDAALVHFRETLDTLWKSHETLEAREWARSDTFWTRLRWIVTGR